MTTAKRSRPVRNCRICGTPYVVTDNAGNRRTCGKACARQQAINYFREYNPQRSPEARARHNQRARERSRSEEGRAKRREYLSRPGVAEHRKAYMRAYHAQPDQRAKARSREAAKPRRREAAVRTCAICGLPFNPRGTQLCCGPECAKARRKAKLAETLSKPGERDRRLEAQRLANLKRRDRLKAYMREYASRPEVREHKKRYMKAYNARPERKVIQKRHNASERAKAYRRTQSALKLMFKLAAAAAALESKS